MYASQPALDTVSQYIRAGVLTMSSGTASLASEPNGSPFVTSVVNLVTMVTGADSVPSASTTLSSAYNASSSERPGCYDTGLVGGYSVAPAVIFPVCFVVGIIHTFFGYRLFRFTLFISGFLFGAALAYLVCAEERLLASIPEARIGISLGAALLCAVVALLLRPVGLFLGGFHAGALLGLAALLLCDASDGPRSRWLSIGLMFGLGLLLGVLALYFQRGVTVLGSSLLGAACLMIAPDYFLSRAAVARHAWVLMRARSDTESPLVCWYSWLLLCAWPVLFIAGMIVQWRYTARGYDHREVRRGARPVQTRSSKANLQKMRKRERHAAQHSRYRYLYQVRRCNGDVISQNFVPSSAGSTLEPPASVIEEPPPQTKDRSTAITELTDTNTALTQVP